MKNIVRWLVGATVGLMAVLTHAAAPLRPNIIYILADDLGYGDLGCYGQKLIQTPNVDRMAAEGMKFTQFYAGCTVCAPSRCVLMTGLHTGHAIIRGNGKASLRPQDVTVAEVLKKAGYTTGIVGKWGLGDVGSTGTPNRKGFDYWYGYLNQVHAHNYYPEYLWRNEEKAMLQNEVTAVGTEGGGYATKRVQYSGDLFAQEALDFIERSKAQPFFLYLALTMPHANNEGTRANGDGAEVPDHGIYANKDWTKPNKGQAAMITRLDGYVGSIFDRLKKLGLDEKTIVFFTSDNGPHKESGNDPGFFKAGGPLRGIKRDLYEGGIRVPMIVRWPGRVKAGSVSTHAGYFGDIMYTFAGLTGGKAPESLDSLSFLPALLGQGAQQKPHEFLYWEFHERGSSQAVVMNEKWKGIRQGGLAAPLELYDLSNDIGEQKNIATEHPDIVAKIEAYLKTARTDSAEWPMKEAPAAGKAKQKASK